MKVEYTVAPEDVAEAVALMTEPGPRVAAARRALLGVVVALLVVALVLIALAELWFWPRLMRLGMPARFLPWDVKLAMYGLPFVWLGLAVLARRLSRDPDGALRWMRARMTRRLLAGRSAKPCVFSFDADGFGTAGGTRPSARRWTDLRSFRVGEGVLVLECPGLWFIVPLRALDPETGAALLAELKKRSPAG